MLPARLLPALVIPLWRRDSPLEDSDGMRRDIAELGDDGDRDEELDAA
jgi:hypothetical protein